MVSLANISKSNKCFSYGINIDILSSFNDSLSLSSARVQTGCGCGWILCVVYQVWLRSGWHFVFLCWNNNWIWFNTWRCVHEGQVPRINKVSAKSQTKLILFLSLPIVTTACIGILFSSFILLILLIYSRAPLVVTPYHFWLKERNYTKLNFMAFVALEMFLVLWK